MFTAEGGYSASHLETGRWLEYEIDVAEAGTYDIVYTVASVPGSQGFEVVIGDNVLDSVEVPMTGGWQIAC